MMSYGNRNHSGMYSHSHPHMHPGHAGPGPALMGADTLIGDHVVNGANERLGDIKDIMLDMQTGSVAYAVLSSGGFLGMGDKLFAVPWQALHLDTVNKRFILDIDRERLQNAPGFDKDAWPDMADAQWSQHIHSFYGTDPMRAGSARSGGGAGESLDPRPGAAGDDTDLSRIRGSNLG
jgi:sporulation protein YlmC with PRC-barrel domain